MKDVLPALRVSLLRCGLILVAAALVATSLSRFAATAVAEHAAESERRESLRASNAPDEAALVVSGRTFRRELLSRGALSPESPPDWRELLARLEDRHRMADIQYELAPARKDPLLPGSATHEFMVSAMTLHLGLRHEQQLLDLLEELSVAAPPIARVNACRVTRTTDPGGPSDVRLAATCVVDWVVLRRKT